MLFVSIFKASTLTHWQSPWDLHLGKFIYFTAKPVNLLTICHIDLFDPQATFISEDEFQLKTWNLKIPIEVGSVYKRKEILPNGLFTGNIINVWTTLRGMLSHSALTGKMKNKAKEVSNYFRAFLKPNLDEKLRFYHKGN